ncbi:hypothetical protein CEXT_601691 [Caerostris extrusa]|uniref:Uncharacterized protein n=1 Tax=Caerostris extrusa TaxID=172846 RepID=A0AAV4MMY6_CAEEX|nr:hypothetical protein CEXT_601691 [Caerostris extrusa]
MHKNILGSGKSGRQWSLEPAKTPVVAWRSLLGHLVNEGWVVLMIVMAMLSPVRSEDDTNGLASLKTMRKYFGDVPRRVAGPVVQVALAVMLITRGVAIPHYCLWVACSLLLHFVAAAFQISQLQVMLVMFSTLLIKCAVDAIGHCLCAVGYYYPAYVLLRTFTSLCSLLLAYMLGLMLMPVIAYKRLVTHIA